RVDTEDSGQTGDALGDGRDGAVDAVDLDAAARAREQLGRIALGYPPAFAKDNDAFAQRLRLVELVRADEHGLAVAPEPADVAPERVARLDVDAERRLVEDQEVRVVEERPAEREAPPEPSGQRSGAVARALGEPGQLEDLVHACVAVPDGEKV